MSNEPQQAGPQAGARAPERLHPISWLFGIIGMLKQMIAPLFAVLVLGQRDSAWALWALPVLLVLALGSALRARAFRYEVTGRELLVREGLWDRSVRHIPLARIQNITQRRNFLHRRLGVTELRLESAAGGKPEAVMKVLGMAAATRLEALLRGPASATAPARADDAHNPGDTRAPAQDTPRLVFHMPWREVVLLGWTSRRGQLALAAALGVVMPNEKLRLWLGQWFEGPLGALAAVFRSDLRNHAWIHLLLLTLGLLLVGLLLLRVMSVAMTVLKYHRFRLELQGERLLASHGIGTQVRAAVRLPRLQRWVLKSTWLQRRLNRCQLGVTVAGESANAEKFARFKDLAPLATPAQAQALLRLCLPALDWPHLPWQPLSEASLKRRLLGQARWGLPLWLAGLGANAALGAPLPWAVLLVGSALLLVAWVLHARAWVRFAACALDGEVMVYRSGVFTQRWVLVSCRKMQTLRLYSSGLDRRLGLQHLQADTQGGRRSARALDIPCLPADQAQTLRDLLWQRLLQPQR
jgi:putative membrane protein